MKQPRIISRRHFLYGTLAAFTILPSHTPEQLPNQPTPQTQVDAQRVHIDDLARLPAVDQIMGQSAEYPKIIHLPLNHPRQAISVQHRECATNMGDIVDICNHLYDNHDIHFILLEGISPEKAHQYNTGGRINLLNNTNETDTDKFWIDLQKLLTDRRWYLYGAETPEIKHQSREVIKPFRELQEESVRRLKQTYVDIINDYIIIEWPNFRIPEEKNDIIDVRFRKLETPERQRADDKLRDYLTDERCQELYDKLIVDRNHSYISQCRQAKKQGHTPIIAVIGGAHTPHFIDNVGLDYAVVLPQNTIEPGHPTQEDWFEMFRAYTPRSLLNFSVRLEGKRVVVSE